ncbi:MAG: hypothetical protein RR595_05260 [Lysinibacillus sp.]
MKNMVFGIAATVLLVGSIFVGLAIGNKILGYASGEEREWDPSQTLVMTPNQTVVHAPPSIE